MNRQHPEAERLIADLDLRPHPEGGWYRETWRAAGRGDVAGLPSYGRKWIGLRSPGTSIYYLLSGREVSRLHRLRSDEIWHFYAGTGLELHLFNGDRSYEHLLLGPPDQPERICQAVVPAGCAFGAHVDHEEGYALVGCTMAPGFTPEDLEMIDCDPMLVRFPDHGDLIRRLTQDPD